MKRTVCIFGASSEMVDTKYKEAAFELGKRIGEKGYRLVFGAGAHGLMGAAARGAYLLGVEIIGVIPERLNLPGIAYEHCTELVVTPTMHTRKEIMEKEADAFITLAGGFGTFEELMEVITLKQLGYIDLPIVILNTCGYYDDIIAMFKRCISESFANERYLALFSVAKTPSEALEIIENYVPSKIRDKTQDMLESNTE